MDLKSEMVREAEESERMIKLGESVESVGDRIGTENRSALREGMRV